MGGSFQSFICVDRWYALEKRGFSPVCIEYCMLCKGSLQCEFWYITTNDRFNIWKLEWVWALLNNHSHITYICRVSLLCAFIRIKHSHAPTFVGFLSCMHFHIWLPLGDNNIRLIFGTRFSVRGLLRLCHELTLHCSTSGNGAHIWQVALGL